MAHKKYYVRSKEWWKHLRWLKRAQNKLVRQSGKRVCAQEDTSG